MRTIQDYMDAAKERHSIASDRKLSEAVGRVGAAACTWRKGKSLPDDTAMIKLAALAGIDETTALIELNVWRTDGAAQKSYSELLVRLAGATLALALMIAPKNAIGAAIGPCTTAFSGVYIITHSSVFISVFPVDYSC